MTANTKGAHNWNNMLYAVEDMQSTASAADEDTTTEEEAAATVTKQTYDIKGDDEDMCKHGAEQALAELIADHVQEQYGDMVLDLAQRKDDA